MLSFCSWAITALALSSLGVITALMFLWAVYCWSNVVAATDGVHVPAGSPTFTQVLLSNSGFSTPLYPWAKRLALLSVGSPFMTRTFGFWTFHAATQSISPWPM